MEEEFNTEEKQSAIRGNQKPITPAYDAACAPYPMYVQPDHHHRQYDMVYGYQSSHMQSDNNSSGHQLYMYDLCKRYKYHLIQCEGTDGQMYDGIIDSVSDDGVYLLVPIGDMDRNNQGDMTRQFDYGYNYGYGGYGYPRRFRRFRRRHFPFFYLRRLFFPYFY